MNCCAKSSRIFASDILIRLLNASGVTSSLILHTTKTITKRDNRIGIGLALLAVIIWSGNFVVARAVFKEIPPVSLAFYRWLLASVLITPFVIHKLKPEWPLIKRSWPYLFFAALTGVALFNTFVYIGAHYSTAINLTLIGTTSSPIIAVILAAVFLKEKIGWMKIAGILLCIAGILFLLSHGDLTRLKFQFTAGDWWVLLAALSFAIYNTLVKKKPAGISSMTFLLLVFWMGTLMLLPFYLIEINHAAPVQWNGTIIFSIVYLGLGASVICFPIWNIAISKIGAARTVLFGNLILVFSSFEAVIFLNEEFTWVHIVSAALVFAGIILSNIRSFV